MQTRFPIPPLLNHLIWFILIFSGFSGFSQDRIFLANGEKVTGTFIGREKGMVYYLESGSSDTVKMAKQDVALVIYQSGDYKIFNEDYRPIIGQERIQKEEKEWNQTPKNLVKANLFLLLAQTAEITYQRRLTNHLAIEFPVTYGWGWKQAQANEFDIRKRFAVGATMLVYPIKKPNALIQFFTGPGIEVGNISFSDTYLTNFHDKSGRIGVFPSPQNSNYLNLNVRAGIMIRMNPWMSIGAEAAPGLRIYFWQEEFNTWSLSHNLNLIVHF
ncbi:hypothetical protein KFE98_01435 [bacterium SCSIO 12741]|nr:hypothetical protein KFE98_01435 [bacterium SCSIO 12741]